MIAQQQRQATDDDQHAGSVKCQPKVLPREITLVVAKESLGKRTHPTDNHQKSHRRHQRPEPSHRFIGKDQHPGHDHAADQRVHERRIFKHSCDRRINQATQRRRNPQMTSVGQRDQTLSVIQPQVQRQRDGTEQCDASARQLIATQPHHRNPGGQRSQRRRTDKAGDNQRVLKNANRPQPDHKAEDQHPAAARHHPLQRLRTEHLFNQSFASRCGLAGLLVAVRQQLGVDNFFFRSHGSFSPERNG